MRWLLSVYAVTIVLLIVRAYPSNEMFNRSLTAIGPTLIGQTELVESVSVPEPREILPQHLHERWTFHPEEVGGLHGTNCAPPAVDASGIYIGTDTGYFYALDDGGQLRWKWFLPDASSGIRSTPVLDADSVYFGATNGVFYAMRKSDGAIRWSKKLGESIESTAKLEGGHLSVLFELRPSRRVIQLAARTGDFESAMPVPEEGWVIKSKTPFAWTSCDETTLCALDLATQAVRARIPIRGPLAGEPALFNHHLYVVTKGPRGGLSQFVEVSKR